MCVKARYPQPQAKQTKMPEAIETTSSTTESVDTVLNLLRHLNPNESEANLNFLSEALPELRETLREVVDVPSRVIVAGEANNREFLSFAMVKSVGNCNNCYR